ncbi:DUF4129 domain-containing protein [Yonghaparkia sp. Root332]|uniref:DUF4129 domain-containing protein n=1 Tax=Yonghaparkia sp. Root332 TaxID=1736516 RepID=UPI0006FE35FE|nr:DUF4129 domain-containing protein [Yonghaparkia sp. Root332]KQV24454.1 hypothetical protein ASC54_07835 [Yonghaparkia sp. Root332]
MTRRLTAAVLAAPLEPDADEARELLLDELAKLEYAQAQPTWFDLLTQSIVEWFAGLRFGGTGGLPIGVLIVGAVLIALAVIAALLIYGLPRWRRRSTVLADLFGESDARTARELRRDAAAAAARDDWRTAIADRYRAIARSLDERTLVALLPGTTAHAVARQAAREFPDAAAELEAAADLFDGVRYLDHEGDRAGYERVRVLDDRLVRSSPLLERPTVPSELVEAPR